MVEASVILAAGELSWLSVALHITLLLVLVLLSGTFSGSETVLFALTPAQLQHEAASGNPFRRIMRKNGSFGRSQITSL